MPSVSIIVPVYNAEKTIERCVSSILDQTYKDFELLLLDDGSTDDSGRICDEYAKRDTRVRVCHKASSGVSDTRNQGIDMAEGEYLQFVDSDDWIIPEATGFFLRAATEHGCDMVIGDFYRVIGERVAQKGTIEKDGILDRKDYAANMMRKPADFYYGVLWNKFYKSSIIKEHQIKMDSAVSWCEDFIFNMEYVRHIDTVYVLKVPMYYYVKTKEEALAKALELIPEGSSISWGGSMSAQEIGLLDAVRAGNYEILDRGTKETRAEQEEVMHQALNCDVFLGSANALSEDGILVNIDGNANRVAAYAYGPKTVLLIVGMNKVVKTEADAMSRAKNEAAPINAQRFGIQTPCVKNGTCADCKSPECICCQILITRFSKVPKRTKVILVDENLGF